MCYTVCPPTKWPLSTGSTEQRCGCLTPVTITRFFKLPGQLLFFILKLEHKSLLENLKTSFGEVTLQQNPLTQPQMTSGEHLKTLCYYFNVILTHNLGEIRPGDENKKMQQFTA